MEYKIQGSVPYDGAQITTFSTGNNSQSGQSYEIGGSAEYSLSFSETGLTGIDWGFDLLEDVFNNGGGENDPTAGFNAVVAWVNTQTDNGDPALEFLLVQNIIRELGWNASNYRNCLFSRES